MFAISDCICNLIPLMLYIRLSYDQCDLYPWGSIGYRMWNKSAGVNRSTWMECVKLIIFGAFTA